MSVRAQPAFLQSWYLQTEKRRKGMEPFTDFVGRELAALSSRSMLHALRYDETHDAYASRFGAGNVRVFVHEDSVRDFAGYLRQVSDLCGIDPEAALQTWGGEHRNARKTQRQNPSLRRVKRLLPGASLLLPRALKDRVNAATAVPATSTEFTAEQEAAIRTWFAAPNRALEKAAGISLEGKGYPLA